MPTPEFVRVRLTNGAEATFGAAFAESENLKVIDGDAVDALGRPLPATYPATAIDLKGAELDTALEDAGLSKTGTVAEKRQRLADHLSSDGTPPSENTGGEPA